MNYNPTDFGSSHIFTVSSDPVLNDKDKVKADGFQFCFDLRIPDSGNLHIHEYINTISLTGGVLDPGDFNFETGGVYMAVHIGGLETNIAGSDSVWAGANPVPAPASLLLLGSGLIGFVAVRRRFGTKPNPS